MHLALLGAFLIVMGLINSEGRMARVGLALFVVGSIGVVLHLRLLSARTNNASIPTMDRLYGACNWILCGLLGLGGFVVFLITLLENISTKTVFSALVFFVIYAAAWGFEAFSFLNLPQVPRTKPAETSES